MLIVRTVADLRARVAELRAEGSGVGFVPTMGALHAGHLELIRQAASAGDAVVLSIFVNPAQFNDTADLVAYPRTEEADLRLAASAGVDVTFIPAVEEVYPEGFSATVALHSPVVATFEGAERGSGHFAGVTTVVTKLFNMVGADRAYFGQKDAQQLHVVRAMVTDLNQAVQIVAVPTVREPDGLALSSRNVRLGSADRSRAAEISHALTTARTEYRAGTRDATHLLSLAGKVLASAGIAPEYLAVVDQATFAPVERIEGPALVVLAARVGDVRLIDNVVLGPA